MASAPNDGSVPAVELTATALGKTGRLLPEGRVRRTLQNGEGRIFRDERTDGDPDRDEQPTGTKDHYHVLTDDGIVLVVEVRGSRHWRVVTQMHKHRDYMLDPLFQLVAEVGE